MEKFHPYSEEFMFLDPEHIDECKEWQEFTNSLNKQNLSTNKQDKSVTSRPLNVMEVAALHY